ncbi:MAG: hypothetical protein IKV93_01910 [Alphaproteobacteria bacterium]|nr:hypothetical protein [Alphaproteobacteria bacterium]
MNNEKFKNNPRLQRLLLNVGIGSYNFKIRQDKPVAVAEKLTDAKMRELFGANYKNIVYYNFDTGTWNRDSYMGYSIGNQKTDTKNANEMRRVMESDMNGWTLVAAAVMAVGDEDFSSVGAEIPSNVQYKRSGNIAGTVVLRNPMGQIVNVRMPYIGVAKYEKISLASFFGADAFAYSVATNADFRQKFADILDMAISQYRYAMYPVKTK